MPSLGPAEILVIFVVALLVFGPDKMPEIARQVGKGFREFRRVQQHLKSELRDVVSEFDSPAVTEAPGPDPVPMLPPKEEPAPAEAPSPAPEDATPTATTTEAPTEALGPSGIPTLPTPAADAAPEAPRDSA
jgi:TatA/E family protein of Tat protein translocase